MNLSTQIFSVVLCAAAAVGAGVWGANWKTRAQKLETVDTGSAEMAALATLVEELSLGVEDLRSQVLDLRVELKSRAVFREPSAELLEEVAQKRGLEWRNEPAWVMTDRTELATAVHAELRRVRTTENWEKTAQAWMVLGVLDEPYDLFAMETALRTLDNRAWYGAHEEKIFANPSLDAQDAANHRLVVNALGSRLVDEHLRALNLPLYLENNDDEVLAARALAEGDAALLAEMLSNEDDLLLGGSLPQISESDLRGLEAVPDVLRVRRQFPSIAGQAFAQVLFESAGEDWALVNEAYSRPPSSTTEVLWPELYLQGWQAEDIDWSVPLWQEGTLIMDNVLGEFLLAEFFARSLDTQTAFSAAQGWRGDRYQVYVNELGESALLWRLHWQTSEDRQEAWEAFVSSYEYVFGTEGEEQEDDSAQEVQRWSDGVQVLELVGLNEHTIEIIQAPEAQVAMLRGLLPEAKQLEDQELNYGQQELVEQSAEEDEIDMEATE